ncbi:MAG: hypothetical protein QNJ87_10860 [Gammaproteobacteria bacterium]|nr:hypothetical protein [Gammaproteobacteria bacterium]
MFACRLACEIVLFAWLLPAPGSDAGDESTHLSSPPLETAGAAEPRPMSTPAPLAPGAAEQEPSDSRPALSSGRSGTAAVAGIRDEPLLPPGTRVRFVDFLPPEKLGMTTGGPGDVSILINRNYPLFVQYSTLVHESVHARDRHLGITPYLSIAERETRALIVELSPANVLATSALASLSEGPTQGQRRVTAFFEDVLAHYRRYSAMAAMQAKRHGERATPSPMVELTRYLPASTERRPRNVVGTAR